MSTSDEFTEACEAVEALGLPPVFAAVWRNEIPRLLIDWQRPERYFDLEPELTEMFPRLESCVPLWESNRDQLFAFDAAANEYIVVHYYHDPRCEVIADNYQGFAAAYLVSCTYAGETHLAEIATLLEFKYLDQLVEWAAVDGAGPSGDYIEDERQFLESIPPGR